MDHEGDAPGLAIDGAKGLPAIEAFLIGRLFMFQQVYLHKSTRSAEWMIRTILARAARLMAEGQRLEGTPKAFELAAHGQDVPLAEYLELDDALLTVTLHAWEKASDRPLADLAARVRGRALFKTLELFGEQASEPGRLRALEIAREVTLAQGLDADAYVGLDVAADVPFEAMRAPLVVFAKGPARRIDEVSFLLSRLANQELSRVRLIFAPELREAITRAVSDDVAPG